MRLKIDILSIDKRNSENTRIPIWLDYYSLKINDEEKLNKLTEVNHDLVKSFYVNYIDRPIIIEFKTRFHQYKYEDLVNILQELYNVQENNIYNSIYNHIFIKKILAICLFGHLRTFEKTYINFYKHIVDANIIDGYDIDIFIHTWDKMSADYGTWYYKKYSFNNKLNEIDVDLCVRNRINEIYKPKELFIETLPKNTHGQKISRKKVLSLVEKSHITYDCIMFTRPDLLFKKDLKIDNFFNLYKFEKTKMLNLEIDDTYFFTSSNIFKRMPVADPRYVNECDLLAFHSSHVLNNLELAVINNKNIPIDYQINKDFIILRDIDNTQ